MAETHYTSAHLDRATSVIVTNDDNGKTIIAQPVSTDTDYGWWLWIESIYYAIFDPSTEGGTLEIKDTDGAVWLTVNTDSIKEQSVPYGKMGIRVGQNMGLIATVANSTDKQASVHIIFSGHTTRRKEYYG
jgi:hypothetical protein